MRMSAPVQPVSRKCATKCRTKPPAWPDRQCPNVRWVLVFCHLATALLAGSLSALAGEPAAPEPSTFLYDAAPASTGLLSDQMLREKQGWALLDEDDRGHHFAGDAIVLNDKMVMVVRQSAAQVDVYSRQTHPMKLCARLRPIAEAQVDLKPVTLSIKENARGSVALEVGLRSSSGQVRHITYQLDAGAPFLQTTAENGIDKLRVEAPCRLAVLPDFFGDDMSVDAARIPLPRTEVPSENFLLHLLPGEDAILMTVSEARDNDIEVALSSMAPRQILSSDVSFGSKPRIWIALLVSKGIWHERGVDLSDAGKIIKLDWHMPYPALWRVDWSTVDKLTDSWEMLLQDASGKYVMQNWFGQDEAEGQRFGKEFGARDWNKPDRARWNPVLGSFTFPCWVDRDGQGYLQPLKERRYAERGPIYNFSGPAVIYPMDRVKLGSFTTPIESLTVVDLVRMTLGVGPCQYILDLEGQKRNSKGVATCYARDVINAIYQEGSQLQNRPLIEEQLTAAVAFISNVRERIDQYVQFGHQMTSYLEEQKRLDPSHAAFIDELLPVTKRLDQFFEANREQIHSPEYARQNAEQFRQTLLMSTDSDAAKKCAERMAVFTSIGGAQDGLVASCRMIVKTLRQRSAIAMALDPSLRSLATEIRSRTQAILRNPTPYEAPRH